MKLVETINLDPIDVNYLEYCHFEWESYKELLSYILLIRDEYSLEYSKDNYDYFMSEYKESKIKYNLKLRDIINSHCPMYQGSLRHDFKINFEEYTLEIYEVRGE